ncbi:hypothetical protein GCM10023222_33890 [Saccharopolyspora cebuensis]
MWENTTGPSVGLAHIARRPYQGADLLTAALLDHLGRCAVRRIGSRNALLPHFLVLAGLGLMAVYTLGSFKEGSIFHWLAYVGLAVGLIGLASLWKHFRNDFK